MIKQMSKEVLKGLLQARGELVLLDVREEFEWHDGHIDGAVLLPLSLIPIKIQDVAPNKRMKIVTYCRSGGRSSHAARQLEEMGYTDVASLEGGYMDYV